MPVAGLTAKLGEKFTEVGLEKVGEGLVKKFGAANVERVLGNFAPRALQNLGEKGLTELMERTTANVVQNTVQNAIRVVEHTTPKGVGNIFTRPATTVTKTGPNGEKIVEEYGRGLLRRPGIYGVAGGVTGVGAAGGTGYYYWNKEQKLEGDTDRKRQEAEEKGVDPKSIMTPEQYAKHREKLGWGGRLLEDVGLFFKDFKFGTGSLLGAGAGAALAVALGSLMPAIGGPLLIGGLMLVGGVGGQSVFEAATSKPQEQKKEERPPVSPPAGATPPQPQVTPPPPTPPVPNKPAQAQGAQPGK